VLYECYECCICCITNYITAIFYIITQSKQYCRSTLTRTNLLITSDSTTSLFVFFLHQTSFIQQIVYWPIKKRSKDFRVFDHLRPKFNPLKIQSLARASPVKPKVRKQATRRARNKILLVPSQSRNYYQS